MRGRPTERSDGLEGLAQAFASHKRLNRADSRSRSRSASDVTVRRIAVQPIQRIGIASSLAHKSGFGAAPVPPDTDSVANVAVSGRAGSRPPKEGGVYSAGRHGEDCLVQGDKRDKTKGNDSQDELCGGNCSLSDARGDAALLTSACSIVPYPPRAGFMGSELRGSVTAQGSVAPRPQGISGKRNGPKSAQRSLLGSNSGNLHIAPEKFSSGTAFGDSHCSNAFRIRQMMELKARNARSAWVQQSTPTAESRAGRLAELPSCVDGTAGGADFCKSGKCVERTIYVVNVNLLFRDVLLT